MMNHPIILCLAILTLAAHCSGCAGWRSKSTERYQTVAAQPHRDAQLAAQENQLAIDHLEKGRQQKAELALQRALVADVTYGPAHNNLGKLYFAQQKYYLAAWEFEYALKLMPDRAEPHYNLGMVHEAAEKLDEAIEFYTTALSMEPNHPKYLGNLVRAQIRRDGDKHEIHALLKQLIFLDDRPQWVAWAREQLATTYPEPATETPANDQDSPKRDPPQDDA